MLRLVIILISILSLGFGQFISPANAEYPTKPVKLIINFSAGGTTDTAARVMVSKATEILEQALICMNKPGAGGTLGISHVARAKNDGYTIGTCNMPAIAVIPQIREVPYKPFKDLVQICAVMPYEYALLVRGDAPWNSWDEFVAYVKANPGKVTYGSVGTGTTNHLVTGRIGKELGLDWRHVPFQGGVKATAALLGGHVDIINNTMAKEGGRFKHFVKHGFNASEHNVIEDFLRLNGASGAVDGFVFHLARSKEPFVDIPAAVKRTERLGLSAQFQVALANENPALAENDDAANANRVAETLAVALAMPQTTVILDTFVDMDRGYFPRTGLVDRRYNPRVAGDVYRNLNAQLGPHSKNLVVGATQKVAGGKICMLKSPECLWVLALPEDELFLSELNLTALGVTELENAVCSDLADGRNFRIHLQKENNHHQFDHKRNDVLRVTAPSLLRFVI